MKLPSADDESAVLIVLPQRQHHRPPDWAAIVEEIRVDSRDGVKVRE